MYLKKLFPLVFILLSFGLFAEDQNSKFKLYGFIGNDFNFNSRQNVELVDGLVQLFPKPISLNSSNTDINATAQAEMLSVNTRIGIDFNGSPIMNAKSTGKIEADFAGFGTSFYVFRIRQAYMKLNWTNTELLIGQSWHPLFGNVMPSTFSINGGAPFQPFNRSPQVCVKQSLTNTLSVTAAAIYEMQYASIGPLGTANCYMKNAMIPDLFVGLENKSSHWLYGAGVDFKTLKPETTNSATISSWSAVAYTQYVNNKFQLKAKVIYGENLSDQLMLGGYGVSKYAKDSVSVLSYTNFRNGSAWINATYGTKFQFGILLGISQNLGASEDLAIGKNKKFCSYGYGFYDNSALNPGLKSNDAGFSGQQILDQLYRIAPHVSYNLPNMKFGLEYDFSSASYGTLQNNGKGLDTYSVDNHRIIASLSYIF